MILSFLVYVVVEPFENVIVDGNADIKLVIKVSFEELNIKVSRNQFVFVEGLVTGELLWSKAWVYIIVGCIITR